MTTLPKHTKVKLVNIYGEELEATIIPLSIKGTMDIESTIEDKKTTLSEGSEARAKRIKKSLDIEHPTDESLFEAYVEGKITMDLSKLNEEISEERIASQKKKRFDKLIEGKTREQVIKELTDILIELEIRKQLLGYTVSRTFWNILRKSDNLREHLFETVEEMEESIDTETLINIFSSNVQETKVEDTELKN